MGIRPTHSNEDAKGGSMKHRYVVILMMLASTAALPSVAQSIYKCGNEYTTNPCAGGKVVLEITPEQVAKANRETDAQSMLRMIRSGNAKGAREMALVNNEANQFNWALQTYRQESAQQAEDEREAALRVVGSDPRVRFPYGAPDERS